MFDDFGRQEYPDIGRMIAALRQRDANSIGAALGNSLQAPVEAKYPKIGEIRRYLMTQGASGALMSGAGSAVFGIFSDADIAYKASSSMPRRFGRAYLCHPQL